MTGLGSSRTFPYRFVGGDGRLRPAVHVVVRGPRASVPATGLVDSGADHSLFPIGWAARLGFDPAGCAEQPMNTAAGEGLLVAYPGTVAAEIREWRRVVQLRAAFTDGVRFVLLGRFDFFEAFRVTIDERAQTLTLAPH